MYPIRPGNLCSQKGRGQRVLAGGAGGSWSIYLGSTIYVIERARVVSVPVLKEFQNGLMKSYLSPCHGDSLAPAHHL